MIIDNKFLDNLTTQAKANPRLQQSFDLRTTSEDNSQRMLNALELGTVMPIHRHRNTSETMANGILWEYWSPVQPFLNPRMKVYALM